MPVPACKKFLQNLVDYLDGKLSTAAKAAEDRHAEDCAKCRILRDSTRQTVELYKRMDLYPVPSDVEARLLQAVDRRIALDRG